MCGRLSAGAADGRGGTRLRRHTAVCAHCRSRTVAAGRVCAHSVWVIASLIRISPFCIHLSWPCDVRMAGDCERPNRLAVANRLAPSRLRAAPRRTTPTPAPTHESARGKHDWRRVTTGHVTDSDSAGGSSDNRTKMSGRLHCADQFKETNRFATRGRIDGECRDK